MRLEFSDFVESDLDEIAAYIAQDNPYRAVSFVQEIRTKFREIQRNPLLFQLRPALARRRVWSRLGIMQFSFASRVMLCVLSASPMAVVIFRRFLIRRKQMWPGRVG